jgi:predicted nucleic acid-binding protein
MTHNGVLLDTSFLIRLFDNTDALHTNAKQYLGHFSENNVAMYISTIAIAEYCVKGDSSTLSRAKVFKFLPFNFDHAKRAGEFAKVVFQNKDKLKLSERNIIPNDTKLFAQADYESGVVSYLSCDTESYKIYTMLKN